MISIQSLLVITTCACDVMTSKKVKECVFVLAVRNRKNSAREFTISYKQYATFDYGDVTLMKTAKKFKNLLTTTSTTLFNNRLHPCMHCTPGTVHCTLYIKSKCHSIFNSAGIVRHNIRSGVTTEQTPKIS